MPLATRTARADDYALLRRLASTDEAGGLAKERSVLLLWFLRNVVGLDDLDAYEFVCDGDADGGVDGIYVESSTGDEDHETLVIYQSKYTNGPTQVSGASSRSSAPSSSGLIFAASSATAVSPMDTFGFGWCS